MLQAFAAAFRTPDLRRKLLFSLAIIAVYRLGAAIPGPGVSVEAINTCLELAQASDQRDIYSLVNLFSGGALLRLSVFALGIMPYITASIIVQLLVVVIPRFEQLKKEGQSGQAKLTQYTRYLTIALAVLQSTGIIALARSGQLFPNCPESIIPSDSVWTTVVLVIALTAGTALIMWLGELLTEKGIGNGMSVLIFTSIAARIPAEGGSILQTRGGARLRRRLRLRGADHRHRRLRRAGAAPHPGAVRQAHGRPAHVRRHVDLPAAEGQPGRRHPGHLRLVAALPAAADHPAAGQRDRRGAAVLRELRHRPEQPRPRRASTSG